MRFLKKEEFRQIANLCKHLKIKSRHVSRDRTRSNYICVLCEKECSSALSDSEQRANRFRGDFHRENKHVIRLAQYLSRIGAPVMDHLMTKGALVIAQISTRSRPTGVGEEGVDIGYGYKLGLAFFLRISFYCTRMYMR